MKAHVIFDDRPAPCARKAKPPSLFRFRYNKRRLRRRLLLLATFVLISGAAFLIYQRVQQRNAAPVRYPEFGITIPAGYAIHGIDVSKYQSKIAWEEVKAMQVKEVQLRFSFIKATEGASAIDPNFQKNWKAAREAGLVRGAYHFFIAGAGGKAQAEHFTRQVKLEPGDLPPVLDVEQLYGADPGRLRQEAMAWLQEAERFYGVKPIIYTNVDFYQRYLGDSFNSYPLWVAHYYQTEQPSIRRDWLFWQHSDKGHVNGIRGEVDFNVFNGGPEELKALQVR